MGNLGWLTLVAALGLGTPALARADACHGPNGVQLVTNPDWAEKPTGDDVARYYPEHAERKNLSGRAVVGCRLRASGAVSDCRVLSETPAGEGFGAAAIKVLAHARFKPRTVDCMPTEGGTVRVPVQFMLADDGTRMTIDLAAIVKALMVLGMFVVLPVVFIRDGGARLAQMQSADQVTDRFGNAVDRHRNPLRWAAEELQARGGIVFGWLMIAVDLFGLAALIWNIGPLQGRRLLP